MRKGIGRRSTPSHVHTSCEEVEVVENDVPLCALLGDEQSETRIATALDNFTAIMLRFPPQAGFRKRASLDSHKLKVSGAPQYLSPSL